jgi:hypothetical protein
MKKTDTTKKIKAAIIVFFAERNGIFHGYELLNFCIHRGVKATVYMDTILRRMRQLRQDGAIKYNLIGSPGDSLYEILN